MLTSKEILQALEREGTPISQKLLVDYVRRGLLAPPIRGKRKAGGRGSESYWDVVTLERIVAVKKLREAGATYDEILKRLGGHSAKAKKRLGLTVWLPDFVAQRLEEIAKISGEPIVRLMQLGARLYHEAPSPFQGLDQDSMQLTLLASGGMDDLPESERVFALWARFATRYWEVADLLRQGKLPEGKESYLFWRVIQDGMVMVAMLEGFGIQQDDVVEDGVVVAQLTSFPGKIRILRPVGDPAQDLNRWLRLAQEHGAVLVTAEGNEFSPTGPAKALAAVGDWLRERQVDGR